VQWICGDDKAANEFVAGLIEEMGYVPVDLGGVETCHVMEAPRRAGAVYGEEYRASDAPAVVTAVQDGVEIPPTPRY
jgi:predicted dinucleotide-binding enzyme